MSNSAATISRSAFLTRAGAMIAVAILGRPALAHAIDTMTLEHPEPRDGITSDRVLSADALGASRSAKVLAEYESARKYPALFDGVACGCSCGGMRKAEHRSLLACYETMQPTGCGACQLEADIVGKLAGEGKSLDEIRRAVDKAFG